MAVALGGVLGAGVRWSIIEITDAADAAAGAWPWGVFVANLVGCALLGLAVSRLQGRAVSTVLGVMVGFCGALTTFSAVAVDAALFLRADHHVRLVTYLIVSFAAGVVAYLAGRAVGRHGLVTP